VLFQPTAYVAAHLAYQAALDTLSGPASDVGRTMTAGRVVAKLAALLSAGVLAAAVAWRASHQPASASLLVFLLGMATLFGPALEMLFAFGAPIRALSAAFDALAVLTAAAFLRFATLFPKPLLPAIAPVLRWHRPAGRVGRKPKLAAAVELTALRGPLRALQVRSLSPAWVWGVAGGYAVLFFIVLQGESSGEDVFRMSQVSLLLAFVGIVLGLRHLQTGYAIADAAGRRGLLWVVHGFAATIWMLVAIVVISFLSLGFIPAGAAVATIVVLKSGVVPVVVLSMAAAIFYFGALDPRLAIRRTSVYTPLCLLLLLVFGGVENLLNSALATMVGMPTAAGTVLAGSVTLFALRPLRRRLDRWSSALLARTFPPAALVRDDYQPTVLVMLSLVDYSRHSERDEAVAASLAGLLRAVGHAAAGKHGGRLAESFLDIILLEFPEPARALAGCRAFVQSFEAERQALGLPRPRFRGGIHIGAVRHDPVGGIHGHAVTVVNRICRTAPAGAIVVSDELAMIIASDEVLPIARSEALEGQTDLSAKWQLRMASER
jgi:class 3 adenylate cyclase